MIGQTQVCQLPGHRIPEFVVEMISTVLIMPRPADWRYLFLAPLMAGASEWAACASFVVLPKTSAYARSNACRRNSGTGSDPDSLE
ncbi:hypothetical protein GF395_02080 [Candidatus Uhrbacteria bacterium]|nr:hypothetical protein [Candidatus Uhrbacteria bacterium]